MLETLNLVKIAVPTYYKDPFCPKWNWLANKADDESHLTYKGEAQRKYSRGDLWQASWKMTAVD